jgi:hypothetical protein
MRSDWGHHQADEYVSFIWQAVSDPKIFAMFRRDPRYVAVVETLWPETGQAYLDLIEDPVTRQICLDSETADKIGGPVTHIYDGAQLAPTTLRYGKVLNDLVRLFPRLPSVEHIAEIGIGHGGQARIIAEYASRAATSLNSYTCLDLLPVLHLARQYLEHFTLRPQFHFLSKLELPAGWRADLAISNYAFSELGRNVQEEYLERVLLRSNAGYLTMNSGLWQGEWCGQQCLSAEALLAKLPNAVLLFEEPLAAPDNYLVLFGNHAAGRGVALEDVRRRARARAAEEPRKKERRGIFTRLLSGGRG